MVTAATAQAPSAHRHPASRRTTANTTSATPASTATRSSRQCSSETPNASPSPGEQVGLTGAVDPEKVPVGDLPVHDPPRRLEHEPLVEGIDLAQDREARDDQSGGEQGKLGCSRPEA